MAKPAIGLLRNLVTVQRRAASQDAVGGQATDWNTVQEGVWCYIEHLTGRELLAAQAIRASDTHRITLRRLPGMSAKDRMVYVNPEGATVYFYLTDVADLDMEHMYMECTANTGVETG